MTVQHNRKLTHSGKKPIPVHRVAVLRLFELFLKSVGAPYRFARHSRLHIAMTE
jgi:hypothetical protein